MRIPMIGKEPTSWFQARSSSNSMGKAVKHLFRFHRNQSRTFMMRRDIGLQVENVVEEGGIKCHGKADECCDNLEGPGEMRACQVTQCDIPFFVLRMEHPVSRFVSKLARFVDE